MSADVEALDRGLVDVGVSAADALARVEVLEKRIARMEAFFAILQGSGSPASLPAGEPSRRLRLVQAEAPIYYCPRCGAGSSDGTCPRGCGGKAS